LIGFVVIAALAIASPVFGLPSSIKKAIKKEVAKQLAGKTGPRGAAGANGANGVNGTNGTARAYAEIQPRGSGGCPGASPPQPCFFDRDQGISSVTWTGTGVYCVVAPGIDSATVVPAVSVDWTETDNPEGNATALNSTDCDTGGFEVRTERINTTTATAAADDNVAFDIVIP